MVLNNVFYKSGSLIMIVRWTFEDIMQNLLMFMSNTIQDFERGFPMIEHANGILSLCPLPTITEQSRVPRLGSAQFSFDPSNSIHSHCINSPQVTLSNICNGEYIMHTPSFFRNIFTLEGISICLILSQIFVKFAAEFPLIKELVNPELPLEQTAWIMTVVWIMLVPLCVQKYKEAFFLGAVWGFLHLVLGILPPLIGACNHWAAGSLVSIQGAAIMISCILAYNKLSKLNSGQAQLRIQP